MSKFNSVYNFQTNGGGRMQVKKRKKKKSQCVRKEGNIEKWDKEKIKMLEMNPDKLILEQHRG